MPEVVGEAAGHKLAVLQNALVAAKPGASGPKGNLWPKERRRVKELRQAQESLSRM